MLNKGKEDRIILGVDPGTTVMGYGLLQIENREIKVLQYGVLKLAKLPNHQLKLKKIFDTITRLCAEYLPDEAAVEMPFYGENPQSMLKLGRAQGVAMAAVLARDIPVNEYLPLQVKQAITGNGKASKEQVSAMLQNLLHFSHKPDDLLDATDALAVALCHYFNRGEKKKKSSGWESFVNENKNRVL